jgi:hypothetical protein
MSEAVKRGISLLRGFCEDSFGDECLLGYSPELSRERQCGGFQEERKTQRTEKQQNNKTTMQICEDPYWKDHHS